MPLNIKQSYSFCQCNCLLLFNQVSFIFDPASELGLEFPVLYSCNNWFIFSVSNFIRGFVEIVDLLIALSQFLIHQLV